MNRILVILFLLAALPISAVPANYVTATLTVTNHTVASNDSLTVNGVTRFAWLTSSSTNWMGTNTVTKSATNIYNHVAANPFSGVIIGWLTSTTMTFKGVGLTASLTNANGTNWGFLTFTTNSATSVYVFQYPTSPLAAAVVTNQASEFVIQLPYATNAHAETVPALSNWVNRSGSQTIGNKALTNSSATNMVLETPKLTNATGTASGFYGTNVTLTSLTLSNNVKWESEGYSMIAVANTEFDFKWYDSGDYYPVWTASGQDVTFETPPIYSGAVRGPTKMVVGTWLTNAIQTATSNLVPLLSVSNLVWLRPIWEDVPVQMFISGRTNAYLPDIVPVDNSGMIFSAGFITNRVAYGNAQMPHGIAWTNSTFPDLYVEPHLHISLSNAPAAGATNVTFHVEYQWGNISGTYSNSSGAISNTMGLMAAGTHYLMNLGHITNNSAVSNLSGVLRMRLTRGLSPSNVFPGNMHVILDSWDVHVPRMRYGSLQDASE